jgi:hypothetical protein
MWIICGLYVDYIWNISEAGTAKDRYRYGTASSIEHRALSMTNQDSGIRNVLYASAWSKMGSPFRSLNFYFNVHR